MSNTQLLLRFGAITQPFGMGCCQTKINAAESRGMTIEEIGPSIVEVNNPSTAINDKHSLKRDISLYKRVRFYSNEF
jgi:hypothetical protein